MISRSVWLLLLSKILGEDGKLNVIKERIQKKGTKTEQQVLLVILFLQNYYRTKNANELG